MDGPRGIFSSVQFIRLAAVNAGIVHVDAGPSWHFHLPLQRPMINVVV